jgi:hypothetical protein
MVKGWFLWNLAGTVGIYPPIPRRKSMEYTQKRKLVAQGYPQRPEVAGRETVLVQREMESGRAPLASITPIPRGSSHSPEAIAARRKRAAAEPQLVSRKWKSIWRISFTAGRATAQNQLATKRTLNICGAKLLNKPAVPAASRWRIPAAALASGVRRVSVSG